VSRSGLFISVDI